MTENVRMVIAAALTISAHVALLLTSSIVKGWVKIARLVLDFDEGKRRAGRKLDAGLLAK